jgi:hypothetical protein
MTEKEIQNLTEEFNNKQGKITAEFSISKDDVLEFLEFTNTLDIPLGRWCIYSCETCRLHSGGEYLHAEIIKWEDK